MPVFRFRSVEEMSRPLWRSPGDPALYRAIAAVWALGRRTGVHHFPPGVHRHRSVEEMSRCAEGWRRANFEAFQRERGRGER